MNSKTYTINGKKIIHRPLSPMQMIRLAAVYTEFQSLMKNVVLKSVQENNDVQRSGASLPDDMIDMNFLYEILQEVEVKNPSLIVRLMNVIFIDAVSAKPCYIDNVLTIDDFYTIDAPTFLEVVADFFTLNDVSKIWLTLLDLKEKISPSSTVLPKPPEARAPETTTGLNS